MQLETENFASIAVHPTERSISQAKYQQVVSLIVYNVVNHPFRYVKFEEAENKLLCEYTRFFVTKCSSRCYTSLETKGTLLCGITGAGEETKGELACTANHQELAQSLI